MLTVYSAVSWAPRVRAHELLCGRPIGRITSCPSVCLSVRPVRAHNSKTKKRRKIKIGTDVPRGKSKWSTNFQLERSEVKLTGREKNLKIAAYLAYMFTYGRPIKRSQAPATN